MIRWVSRASQRSLVAATLLLCFTAMNAWSQDVALTSADGTLTIEGRLLSFDGEYYQIRSAYGDLTLDGSGVHCQGPGCPSVNAFIAKARIVGATALGETLMPVLIEGFASQEGLDLRRVERAAGDFSLELMNSDTGEVVAEFQFELSDTLTGFAALEAEEADFALARFAYEGTKFGTPRVLGLDAVTFSVAAENPMRAVPLDALTQILRGQVENWAELGGPDLPLIAMGEVDEVDDQLTATTAFMAEESQTLSGQVVDRVSDDSISIGLTRLSDPGGAVALDLLGGCDVGFVASPQNLKTGDYPFASPQFLYQSANRKPRIIRQFLRYLATDSAARDAEFSGFVSHNLIEIPLEAQGTRIANAVVQAGNDVNLQDLQEMMAELRDAQRLTLTFRFRTGATQLDVLSNANLDVLVHHIETGRFDGKELVLAGFSDGDGGSAANRSIALKRAQAIRSALLARSDLLSASDVTLTPMGFGEAMPLACDSSEFERQINRRVEVWVRDLPQSEN